MENLRARPLAAACLMLLLTGCGDSGAPQSPATQPEIVIAKLGVEMVRVPAGTFEMGNAHGKDDQAPVHTVAIDDFLMDRTEVTQEQFAALKLPDPSHFKNAKNPVEMMTLDKAVRFCNARSKAEGLTPCYDLEGEVIKCNFDANGYRLPTEAEWEYACRAGSTADFSFGKDERQLADYGWFKENSGPKAHPTHPVGQKKPNAWGLYDMLGNVAEWCNDAYDKDYYKNSPKSNPTGPVPTSNSKYVLRGGAWDSPPEFLRSAHRLGQDPGFVDACLAPDAFGFRCVRRETAKK